MKRIGLILLGLLLVVAVGFGLFTDVVPTNAVGLRISSGGQVLATDLAPGRYLVVPAYTHLAYLPQTLQTYISDKSEVNANDKTFYEVQFAVVWRIADAKLYYKTFAGKAGFSGNPSAAGTTQVDNIVYANVKEALRSVDSQSIKTGTRTDGQRFFGEAVKRSDEALREFGIAISDIRLTSVDLAPSSRASALNAQVQSVATQAAEITAKGNLKVAEINSVTTKQAGEILGEAETYVGQKRGAADAEALRLTRQAVPDPALYKLVQAAGVVENLPEGTRMVIGPESDLYQFLQGAMGR
ncbi:MAG: SPFH domain-containing protein [Mycobacterium leprae]